MNLAWSLSTVSGSKVALRASSVSTRGSDFLMSSIIDLLGLNMELSRNLENPSINLRAEFDRFDFTSVFMDFYLFNSTFGSSGCDLDLYIEESYSL